MSGDTTWRMQISIEMRKNADDWKNVVKCTLSEKELDTEFDDGYGSPEGQPFVLWTKEWVYFPICYDGAEWAGSAPRNPRDEPLQHQGGC